MATLPRWDLSLIDGWHLRSQGQLVGVAIRQERVIAALAFHKSLTRTSLSGLLWPNSSESKAAGNLRASIWVISHTLPDLLVDNGDPLELREDVSLDIREVREKAGQLDASCPPELMGEILDHVRDARLLPGWYEDWIVDEQQHWDLLRLNTLERLARIYLQRGDMDGAMESSIAATSIDPFRESAIRLKIQTFLAEGNVASAITTYTEFQNRLLDEYGVTPSEKIASIMDPILNRPDINPKSTAPPVDRRASRRNPFP
jgi:DNA-binding SARP family transcriptional activator